MQIKPIPLGLILFGGGILIGQPLSTLNWFLRNPVWAAENWRSMLKGLLGWMIFGLICLVGGIVGWMI